MDNEQELGFFGMGIGEDIPWLGMPCDQEVG